MLSAVSPFHLASSGARLDCRFGPVCGYSFCMSPVGVVSFEEARHMVEQRAALVFEAVASAAAVETVELLAGRGRVLAEAILADRDFPPFARATRDGYAVRAEDVRSVPARLEVVGEIRAGDSPEKCAVQSGQAVSIMTGAALPAGADAVVMVEYTARAEPLRPGEVSRRSRDATPSNAAENAVFEWGTLGRDSGSALNYQTVSPEVVEIQRSVESGENFVPRGAEARAGQMVVESGRRLEHALIAVAAAAGKSRVRVFRRPRVVVLSTGDELVEIDATPGAAQIRNSNSYSLAAQIEEAGGEAVRLSIAPDEPVQLRVLIEEGLSYDLLLLTGGVSMGKYDLVEQVLGELRAEFYFTGAKIQPGKPVVFGSCSADALVHADSLFAVGTRAGMPAPHDPSDDSWHYFFGLPGNPVSTMVTFELFVRPMLAALGGMKPEPLVFLNARLKSEVRTKAGLTRFLPARISGEFENAEVDVTAWQGSGDIAIVGSCQLLSGDSAGSRAVRGWGGGFGFAALVWCVEAGGRWVASTSGYVLGLRRSQRLNHRGSQGKPDDSSRRSV